MATLATITLTDSTRIVVEAVTASPAGVSVEEQFLDKAGGPWLPTRAVWLPQAIRADVLAALATWPA